MELTAKQLGTRHPWILPNVKIYANPLTNQILKAGHMGIESELVDADYPTFLVYNKSWEKMKKEFYGIEELKMQKSQELHPEEEMMMVTSMEELDIANLITGSQHKIEEIDLKEVDSYMDMFLMENTEAEIKETLPEESIKDMMYEEDRFWNMNKLTDWNDEFRIELRNSDYEQLREKEDKIEQEAIMLTNVECEDLKKYKYKKQGRNQEYSAKHAPNGSVKTVKIFRIDIQKKIERSTKKSGTM